MKWEYLAKVIPTDSVEAALRRYPTEGWEFVSLAIASLDIMFGTFNKVESYLMVFRREQAS